jgi:hypothetical protein
MKRVSYFQIMKIGLSTRAFLFLLLVYFTNKAECQTDQQLLVKFIEKSKHLKKIQSAYQNRSSAEACILRKIDANHKQLVIENSGGLDVLLQEDSSGIYLISISKAQRYGKAGKSENIFFKTDTARLKSFILQHDSVYGGKTTIDMFKNYKIHRFGPACYYSGMPSDGYRDMKLLVSNQDSSGLKAFIKQPNYELKIIGAVGLLSLESSSGICVEEKYTKIIRHLRLLNLPINFCLGCTEWEPMLSWYLIDCFR